MQTAGERFALAPMSSGIRALTWALFVLPVGFVLGGLVSPVAWILVPTGLFVALAYASVWLWWRPGAFVVGAEGLLLDFPMRKIRVPIHDVAAVAPIAPPAVREKTGFAMRIGAGGLWGGFGWLWTRRLGMVEFYVSRLDGGVWIDRRTGRPLLITPEHPERFAQALARYIS